jgi:hypothetical protein
MRHFESDDWWVISRVFCIQSIAQYGMQIYDVRVPVSVEECHHDIGSGESFGRENYDGWWTTTTSHPSFCLNFQVLLLLTVDNLVFCPYSPIYNLAVPCVFDNHSPLFPIFILNSYILFSVSVNLSLIAKRSVTILQSYLLLVILFFWYISLAPRTPYQS